METDSVTLRIRGSSSAVESYLASVTSDLNYRVESQTSVGERNDLFSDEEFGQVEMIDLVVSFAISVGANVATPKLMQLADRFRGTDKAIEVEVQEQSNGGSS